MMKNNIWSEDPKYTRSNWKYEVCNDATNLGYWEWVDSLKNVIEEPEKREKNGSI
jgi:hypothetical protein